VTEGEGERERGEKGVGGTRRSPEHIWLRAKVQDDAQQKLGGGVPGGFVIPRSMLLGKKI